jgi:hypothetical protein
MTQPKKDWTETHIEELGRLQARLDNTPEVDIRKRVDILSDMLILIGKLAAEFTDEYKGAYIARKQAYAEAEFDAPKRPQAYAELQVKEHRQREREASKLMKRWDNAFTSTKEKINALKFQVKIDIEDGSSRRGG